MRCTSCGTRTTGLECQRCGEPLDRTIYAFSPDALASAAAPPGAGGGAATLSAPAPGRTCGLPAAGAAALAAPPSGFEAALAAPRPEGGGGVGVLLSPVLAEPVRLEMGMFYRIGRDAANDIVFPSPHVSRLHADLVFENGSWVIEDLGSKNGVFVNGDRVPRRALRDGDRIGIWRFELLYREIPATGAGEPSPLDSSEMAALRATQDEMGFSGEMRQVSIIEMVQILAANKKTGVVEVDVGDPGAPARRLFLEQGVIVHAEYGSLEGERAVRPILRTPSGRIRFRPSHDSRRPRTVRTPTGALLLQALETVRL